jgi:hypothetical protein
MTEVVASRLATDEKRLVQALAARRQTLVGHLIRDLLLQEVRKEMGEDVLPADPESRTSD